MAEETKVITVGLPSNVAEALKSMAIAEENSVSNVVRRILKRGVGLAPEPSVRFSRRHRAKKEAA